MTAAGSRCSSSTPTHPGLTRTLIPIEIRAPEKQFTLFFDDVAGSVPTVCSARRARACARCSSGSIPSASSSAAIGNGVGRYALDRAAAYAKDRVVWDVPIAQHQGIAHPLAEAKIDVELARLMMYKAAWAHDRFGGGAVAGEAANMAKFAAADASLAALDTAIQTHGGNGMASEYGLADLWGLLRLLRIAPISREMILNFVAQQSLGLPKSY